VSVPTAGSLGVLAKKSPFFLCRGVANNPKYTAGSSVLAEVGTVQLEFKYLSFLTGNPVYHEKAQKAMDVLDNASKKISGLYPLYISPTTGQFTTSQISFGALADSFYEYLIKQFLQTRKQEDQFKRMCTSPLFPPILFFFFRISPFYYDYYYDYYYYYCRC